MILSDDLIQIFRLSPAPILLLYPDSPAFTIALVNQAYLDATRITEAELIGKAVFSAFPINPELKDIDHTRDMKESLEFVLLHKVSHKMPLQQFDIPSPETGKFQEKYWESENIPVMGQDQEIRYIMHCVEDVTARVLAEKSSSMAREQSQQRFQSLVQDGSDLVAILDIEGNYIYVSPTSIRVMDMDPEEFLGKNAFTFIHPEDVDRVMASFSSLDTQKRINLSPFRFRDKKGEYRWIETVITNLLEDPAVNGIVANSRDITNRMRAEQEIVENEKKLRTATRIAKLGYWRLNLESQQLYWSDEVYEIWGRSKETFQPSFSSFLETIHPEDRPPLTENRSVALAGLIDHDIEHRIILPDGSVRWVHEIGKVVYDNTGKTVIFEGTVQDITPQKLLALSLEESNQRYDLVSKATSDAIWDWDIQKNSVFWGEGFRTNFGYDPRSVNVDFDMWASLIHPRDREGVIAHIQSILKESDPNWMNEYRLKKSDGTFAYVIDKGFVIRNEKGEAIRMVGSIQDITKNKQEEHQLKLLESVVTNTKDAIVITEAEPQDEPGPRIIYVNDAFTKMTGYTSEEVIGRNPRFLQGPKSDYIELARLKKAMKNWQPCEITTINYKKNGEEFWLNFTITPVADHRGWYTHWIAIERDITNRKNLELQKLLLERISQSFYETTDLKDALWLSLKQILGFGDFSFAQIWLVNSEMKKINLVANALNSPSGDHSYRDNDVNSFLPGEGLPGITWASKSPQYGENIFHPFLSENKNSLQDAQHYSASAFPLVSNDDVMGVLVLGHNREGQTPSWLKTLFNELTTHLSVLVKRKQLEQQLSHIFSFSPDIIAIVGNDGFFKKINPAAADSLGYTEEELLKTPFLDFVHPHDRSSTSRVFEAVNWDNESATYFENRYLTRSGKTRWLAWTAAPSPEEGMMLALAKDITEKKNLENLLKKTTTMAGIGSWDIDIVDQSIFWSPLTREIHEVEESFEPDYNSALEFYLPGPNRETISKLFEEAVTNGKPFDTELTIQTAKGNLRWVRVIGEAEFINGECTRVYGSLQDIHERKTAQLDLIERARELALSNAELEQFAYVASHDLQEPLRMVTSFLTQLEKKYSDLLDEKGKRYIYFAVDGAKRMRQIILDLLEFSRAGRTMELLEYIDLNELVRDIKQLYREQIEEKNARIINTSRLPTIYAHRSPLRQVLLNLIGNALKYTRKDVTPEIRISATERENDWIFSISDNGIGISSEFHEKIFVIFQRLHRMEEHEGTGMGLAITKKIIENAGGKIWVESVYGSGSIFYFTITKNQHPDETGSHFID